MFVVQIHIIWFFIQSKNRQKHKEEKKTAEKRHVYTFKATANTNDSKFIVLSI